LLVSSSAASMAWRKVQLMIEHALTGRASPCNVVTVMVAARLLLIPVTSRLSPTTA
jgi:hypothetical protein